jgi:hypothetical protein
MQRCHQSLIAAGVVLVAMALVSSFPPARFYEKLCFAEYMQDFGTKYKGLLPFLILGMESLATAVGSGVHVVSTTC